MLCVRNLTLVYPDQTKALDNLDFTWAAGENIALIGENGAGKTSLLLTIVGILTPAVGSITVKGTALSKKTLQAVRREIGLVFQNPDDQLFMPFVYDDIAFGCRNIGLPEEQIKTQVAETLNALDIDHLHNRSSLKLSGGEKRMAAIATVLAMKPSFLLFDEPTAFLDPKARRKLIGLLQKLPHAKMIATHDMAFAAEVCDRVILLKDGRITASGGTALLYDKTIMRSAGLEEIALQYEQA